RAAQLAVNLERLRWLPRDPGSRRIRVNIPEFKLEVVENGETALSMRAVVGRVDRPTPVLSGVVTCMEVNPYWNIPQKIARDDLLPHVQRDPGYLSQHNIRVYENWRPEAKELEPHAIDWQDIATLDLAYKLRQEPGPQNALGRIKFMFANPFSVYIHDTPNREKFTARNRSFSSGCVRVENPLTLAAYLLRGGGAPGGDGLMAAVDSPDNARLGLPRPVPVHLVYLTAWADRDGVTHFRDDIYGYDAILSSALAERR
ncbi:L,D-transpeptidase family protein, partial [bacterium]|nr:L,D-transpeptidase family protein [bacterium]